MDDDDANLITTSKLFKKVSLLNKYNIPVENLSYEYITKCKNIKELERIVLILRSGEEGIYPDLIKHAEEHLTALKPDSMVLRIAQPIITSDMLENHEKQKLNTDINDWEKLMSLREKVLEIGKTMNLNETIPQPGIRQNIINNNPTPTLKNTKRDNRIKACDYSAWDKFDADTELDRIDLREEQKKAQAKRVQKEKNERIKQMSAERTLEKLSLTGTEINIMAEQEKEKGNEAFRAGDYEEALQFYNTSLAIDSTINGYNNRALTYIKLKRFQDARQDCNKVLLLDYTNVKGLVRRAIALENLGENGKALADYETVLMLEPTNKVAINAIKKLRVPCESKKVRIKIEDENDMYRQENKKDDKISPRFDRGRFEICLCDKAPSSSHYMRPLPHKKSVYCYDSPPKLINKIKTPKPQTIFTQVERTKPTGVIIEELPNVPCKLIQQKKEEICILKSDKKAEKLMDNEETIQKHQKDNDVLVKLEKIDSPYEFFCVWQSLKVDPNLKLHAQLLRSLTPENIETFIGNKLDANMFSTILHCLEQHFCNPDDAILLSNFLKSLSKLNRFSIISLFCDKADKKALDKMFAFLDEQQVPDYELLHAAYE